MPTPIELTQARRRWPRVIGIVREVLVADFDFASRVVLKASRGDELYLRIVRDAWQRRRVKRWMKGLK